MVDIKTEIGKAVAEAEYIREHNDVQIAINASLPLLKNRKSEIDVLFESNKRVLALENVKIILGTEIAEAVRGRMIVPEYSQKGSAKQTMYVFVGTHWKMMPIQIYYDYVREACRRIGLSEIYVQSPEYMNKVFEKVSFITSQYVSTVRPHDGVWINLRNCTVEIYADGRVETHEHRADDFFLYCLPYCYNPEAECPRWLKFLNEVLPEKASQTLLGEYVGYCFTQNIKLEKMVVFYGGGANGKSVCLDVIKKLMGRNNVSEGTLSSLTNDPEARHVLENKLVNISSESGRNLNAAVLKMLISGEPVEMRKLYEGTRMLYNPPKLITSYNELPPVENTHGYRRRWILFPFNRTIADNMQDPALADKLATELPGILNWVLMHLLSLLQRVNSNVGEGFTFSKECNDAVNTYFKSANSALCFLEECCKADEETVIKIKDLYIHYQNYCKSCGISKPMILKNFKKCLSEWGATLTTKYDVIYVGVKVDVTVYS